MTYDELRDLNIIKTVHRKAGKYAVNGAPFQSPNTLRAFLLKQRNIDVSVADLTRLLDELAEDVTVQEKTVQERIQRMFGGEREVKTPVGYIDLLNDDVLYEVKKARDWKHAFGQVLAYKKFYPNHTGALYLFGECPKNINNCYTLCRENKIKLYCEFY